MVYHVLITCLRVMRLIPKLSFSQAVVTEEEEQYGLWLQPEQLTVVVKDSPISSKTNIFSQFTVTLSGKISCIGT